MVRVCRVSPLDLLTPGGIDVVFDAPDGEDENDHNEHDDRQDYDNEPSEVAGVQRC